MGYRKVESESGQSCPEPEKLGETWACWRWEKVHNHTEGPAVREIVQRLRDSTTPQPTPSPRPQRPQIRDQLTAAEGRNLGKNLFVDLAETIAHELGVTKCRVCGGALTSEHWPWKGAGLGTFQLPQRSRTVARRKQGRPQSWGLSSEVAGEECPG